MLHCIRFKISLESEFKAKQIQSKTRLFALAKRDGLGFRFFASALPRNSSHEVRTLSLEKVLLAELCFAVKRTLRLKK
ncbi:hypothetical protein FZT51_06570 [Campylobacter upsaliensis]|nr:hypothetical protein [Campylobacter upsaliensis]EGK8067017.1 hypothetical protein [Campylobacter upsaliensis]EGX7217214.1 hypothetical protein [Campylobacter upsaliensis]